MFVFLVIYSPASLFIEYPWCLQSWLIWCGQMTLTAWCYSGQRQSRCFLYGSEEGGLIAGAVQMGWIGTMMSLCRAFPSELAPTSGGDPRVERVTVAETSCKVTHRVQNKARNKRYVWGNDHWHCVSICCNVTVVCDWCNMVVIQPVLSS